MLHTEILIVGQGIAGTLLSVALSQKGIAHMVLDAPNPHCASRVASALINPLIGKKWTLAPEADLRIPVALGTYRHLEALLGVSLLRKYAMLVFHPDASSADVFASQIHKGNPYLQIWTDDLSEQWHYTLGVGCVQPVYAVDASLLLQEWRSQLAQQQQMLEESFSFDALQLGKSEIRYKDINANKIIFCSGASGRQNPLFPSLPFTANRGDVLLLQIPELSKEFVYHQKMRLVPFGSDLFWFGSNYTWSYTDLNPDEAWRNHSIQELAQWLKMPFQVVDHLVAERPTTAGQQVLMLQHPQWSNVFCLNGLGTRGFSAGPFWVQKMMGLLLENCPSN